MIAVMVRARSGRLMASRSACFSGAAKGQTMASEVTSAASPASSIAFQSPSMPLASK